MIISIGMNQINSFLESFFVSDKLGELILGQSKQLCGMNMYLAFIYYLFYHETLLKIINKYVLIFALECF